MPLIICPDCGQKISTRAAACPGCGAPTKVGSKPVVGRAGATYEALGTVLILISLPLLLANGTLGLCLFAFGLLIFVVGRLR